MFAVRPVSTKVIFQSSMSLASSSTFFPPPLKTKSLEAVSSYSRKYFLIESPLYPRQRMNSLWPKCA